MFSIFHIAKKTVAKNLRGPGGGLEVLHIAVPLVISQACETVMMFTDRLFLSKLGPEHMAAAMGGGVTSFLFVTFFIGLIGYSTAMVAQNFGANKIDNCAVVTTQTLLLSLCAYPIILTCLPLGRLFFNKAGISPEQLFYQIPYFQILMFGTITILLKCNISSFFSGIGKTRIIMIANIVSMLSNVGINYVLIFGKMGFPQLGIKGAAYGTIISGGIGLLILCFAYFGKSNMRQYYITKSFRFSSKLMKELLSLGYPAGLELFLNLIGFTVMITAFHSQGLKVATAITIAFNWDMVAFIPLIGVNIAITSLVGRYIGAQDLQTANRSTFSALKVTLLYTAILLIPFGFFTEAMVDLFHPAQASAQFHEIRNLSIFMVRFIALYLIADATLIVFSGALRGAGDTFWTMLISVSMHWTFAILTMLMFFVFEASPETTWITVIMLFMSFGPIFYLRYRSGHWKTKLTSAFNGVEQNKFTLNSVINNT